MHFYGSGIMASDWVKMRTDLYRDPKVIIIADIIGDPQGELGRYVDQNTRSKMNVTRNVTRNVTVGALVTLWGTLRHNGKRNGDDLVVAGATLSVVDDIVDLPGFGEALGVVGWAREDEDCIVFPNFYREYNADPAGKSAKSGAERQKEYRKRKAEEAGIGDVTRDEKSDVTECHSVTSRNATEKSRVEENRDKLSIGEPPKEKRKRFTPPTLEEVRAFCTANGLTWSPQRFIDHYAAGGWKLSGGRPMADWQAAARNWKDYGATPYQPPPKPEPPRKMLTPIPRNV